LKSLNLDCVRSSISLVSQEPILFNYSLKENILYGVDDDVPMSVVEEAARKANAHTFISRLPQGYDTIVGAKGSQLSGGQVIIANFSSFLLVKMQSSNWFNFF
jgi:ABC-type multidrug transport system fused ATPase/permease subunit